MDTYTNIGNQGVSYNFQRNCSLFPRRNTLPILPYSLIIPYRSFYCWVEGLALYPQDTVLIVTGLGQWYLVHDYIPPKSLGTTFEEVNTFLEQHTPHFKSGQNPEVPTDLKRHVVRYGKKKWGAIVKDFFHRWTTLKNRKRKPFIWTVYLPKLPSAYSPMKSWIADNPISINNG